MRDQNPTLGRSNNAEGLKVPENLLSNPKETRPTREEAKEAVRVLLRWAGEDPTREGLLDTPKRFVKAFEEYFAGYALDPADILSTSFGEVEGYQDMVLLKDIRFESHCEHHIAPIVGRAHVAYLPQGRVVGISKLARLVDLYAKRLQIQERLTAEIANALEAHLQPNGLAVIIDAEHHCMTCRGVHKVGASMTTQQFRGAFAENPDQRQALFRALSS